MMNDAEGNFDILSYWKVHEFRYPLVAAMARDILSIHISTVASESTFSVSGCVIDQYRSLLKTDIVEALVCTGIGYMKKNVIFAICIFYYTNSSYLLM